MSLPRYPTYKNTVTDWLGEVPEHWSVNRFKLSVDSCTNGVWGDEASNDENDVICIRVADFDRHRLEAREPDEPTIRNVSDRDIEQRSLRNGDLLIEKSGGGEKQPVGAVVLYTGTAPAVCSNFVARMRLKRDLSPSFWKYAHHAAYSARLNTKSIKQTSGIQNLDQQQYLDESAAYPPLEEQLAIASFLDRETAKIDALIAEQQRLIELLQEKRQAVISHAVTKGLNPDAPMKDSGVEWLGEVQEHWEVKPLKYLANIQTGMAKGKDLEGVETADIPYLRVANVQDGYLDLDEVHLLPVPIESISRYLLRTGDVLMNEGGDFDKLGRGCIWSGEIEPCVHQNHVFAVRPHSISGEWLNAYTTSKAANSYFIGRSKQSTNLASISSTNLMGLSVPVPPSEEASEILGYMNARVQEIDDLKLSATQAVDLLQERRSALISAAVTGQIDVRGLVEMEGGEQ